MFNARLERTAAKEIYTLDLVEDIILGHRRFFLKAKKPHKGFTLIEVMIATAILSLGAVLIYEAFFISVDTFDYYANYLQVGPWLEEKIWETRDTIKRLGPSACLTTEGVFTKDKKDFNWSVSCDLIDTAGAYELYRVNLILSWQQGHRSLRFLRSAYVIYEEEQKT